MKKFVPAVTGATHVAVDATILEVILPTTALADNTSNLIRSGTHVLGGWLARGYRDNKTFSL